jgi:glycosyltransferase involved in cell wall biosynthesis
MKKNILLSIVIPCYNDAQYIEQAVLSALNQTYTHKEVIVVDDGSNVETKLVLISLENKITKLITQENQGQSTARNNGIKEAKGQYILVLDSDDYFEPTFCEKAIAILENENVKLVTSYLTRFDNDKNINEYCPQGGDISAFIFNNEATGSVMFRKKDCVAIGGYDEVMRCGFEDWEFYIRLLKVGGVAYIVPEFLFNYRIKKDSTTSKANKIKYELLHYIYIKHRDLYMLHFDLFISYLLSKTQREELEKIKNKERLEFKIGKAILRPLRWMKTMIK